MKDVRAKITIYCTGCEVDHTVHFTYCPEDMTVCDHVEVIPCRCGTTIDVNAYRNRMAVIGSEEHDRYLEHMAGMREDHDPDAYKERRYAAQRKREAI